MSTKTIRDLEARVERATSTEDTIAALVELCSTCSSQLYVDPHDMRSCALRLKSASEEMGDEVLSRWADLFYAMHYSFAGDYDTAMALYNNLRKSFEETNDERGVSLTLLAIGRVHILREEWDEAHEVMFRSLHMEISSGDAAGKVSVLMQLGKLYVHSSSVAEYVKLLEEHLPGIEHENNTLALAEILNRAGATCIIMLNQPEKGYNYAHRALGHSLQCGSKIWEGLAHNSLGAYYWYKGDAGRTIEHYLLSVAAMEEEGDKSLLVRFLSDAAFGYELVGEYEDALAMNLRAKTIIDEIGQEKQLLGWVECGIGMAKLRLGDAESALEHFAHSIENINPAFDQHALGYAYYYKGEALSTLGRFDESYQAFLQSLDCRKQTKTNHEIADTQCEIAKLLVRQGKVQEATAMLRESLSLVESMDSKNVISSIHKALSEAYFQAGKYAEAYEYLQKHVVVRDEIQSQESAKKAASLKYLHERELHQKEQKTVLEILYKTLPHTIADRMIAGETVIADHYKSVSVLFADVVGFTPMTSAMPPGSILRFMNFLFGEFDTIASRYGCERIKTIGDGYMAVCGAPVMFENHAERLACMAVDMMKDISLPEDIRAFLTSGQRFSLRIGLHCGEITAGLIGTGKLAYDIYGDAVNTASRMESHGEAGKIHCTEDFMNASSVSSDASFHFHERGEMIIKGKGKMKTYFLEPI